MMTVDSKSKWSTEELKLLGRESCSGRRMDDFALIDTEISTDFINASIVDEK